ncbi:hypothetical protein HO173_012980 [Letharia columbiana]|uniref:Uncharacterized protein n=1 Tax=Letharia columbiana TaxID=112416 RepID=A0A8H6CJK2_9LECA|nr:uncharacterized protein HO173_012980 [Letharia columbiana]KAF6224637.1 hypothetical protein HO173_012980 [Letharia columbiana]
MLVLNIALLALSALPTALTKAPPHHLTHPHTASSTFSTHPASSTFSTHPPATNATTPLTSTRPIAGTGCPTVTKTVAKTVGVCEEIRCLPVLVGGTTPVATSTFAVGCACPAATPTVTLSRCDLGCEGLTAWVYETAGGIRGGCRA